MENPPDNPDPAKLGNTKFVLDSKTGDYQVAAIAWMPFRAAIDPQKLDTLAKLEKDLAAACDKAGVSLNGDEEDSEKRDGSNKDKTASSSGKEKDGRGSGEDLHAKESLTAKTKDQDDKQKNESLVVKRSLLKALFEDLDDSGEDGEEEDKLAPEVEKAQKACFDFYNKFQAAMEKKPELDAEDFNASRTSFYQAIAETNKLRAANSEEAKLKLKKTAAGQLKTYFETFVGKANVKGLDEKSMAIYLVGVGDGEAKVSDFAGMVSKDRSAIDVADGSAEV